MGEAEQATAWWRLTGPQWRVYLGSILWPLVFVVLVALGVLTGKWLWYQVLLAVVAGGWSAVYVSSAVALSKKAR